MGDRTLSAVLLFAVNLFVSSIASHLSGAESLIAYHQQHRTEVDRDGQQWLTQVLHPRHSNPADRPFGQQVLSADPPVQHWQSQQDRGGK
jgi:hypothetical protein